MKITVTSEMHIDVAKIAGAVDGDAFWTFAATEWWRLITPYTPKDSGALAETVSITPKTIEYTSPYAHYQYVGDVYGPSIPIMQSGAVVGFFSKKGETKHPTGAKLKYTNPLASAQWDKAAEPTQKSALIARIQEFIDGGGLNLGT